MSAKTPDHLVTSPPSQHPLEQVIDAVVEVDKHFANHKASSADWEEIKTYLSRAFMLEDFLQMALEAAWDGGDLDGGSIQDTAEAYGLIEKVKCTEENRNVWNELDGDFEVGSHFYKTTKLGKATSMRHRRMDILRGLELPAIQRFVNSYIEQDNAGTRWPYAYVLQQRKMIPVPAGMGEVTLYSSSAWELYEKTAEEMLAIILEIDPEFTTRQKTTDPAEHEMVDVYEHVETWEDEQWFLTKAELEQHLAANNHNYKHPVRAYVKYFHRNEEMPLIMRTMFAIAGKDFNEEAKMLRNIRKWHGDAGIKVGPQAGEEKPA